MADMDPTSLVLLSLAVGIVVGVGLFAGIATLQKASKRRRNRSHPPVPRAATQVLQHLPEAAVLLSTALKPVYANPAAQERGSGIDDAMLTNEEFKRAMRRVLSTGAPYEHMPDGEDAQQTLRIRAFRVKKRFVVVLVDDVGEAQRLTAMRRDFIANVSHEFKTPIAAIQLLAEAIQEAADDPELVQQFADTLRRESVRLGELSRDIIHLSEAQSAIDSDEREPVVIPDVVRSVVAAHEALAQGRNIRLVVTPPTDHERSALILGRANALGIAIGNVLSNAIRYSPDGGRVGIGMEFRGDMFEVTIADSGPGIPIESQERIFERFYRVDNSRNRSAGGTGLGLSITRHTMRGHGGGVQLWSQVNVGSTFTLQFPVHEPQSEEMQRPSKRSKKRSATKQKA